MSLDEVIDQFQRAIDQIDTAITSVSVGEDAADETDSWRTQLQMAVDTGNQVIEQVKAAKG